MAYAPPSNYPVQYMPSDQAGEPMQVVTHTPQRQTVYVDVSVPKDHIVWSMFHFIYCNPMCLGLAAFLFSIKSRDRKMAGDYAGAKSYASTACCLNIFAFVITVLITVLVLSKINSIIHAITSVRHM